MQYMQVFIRDRMSFETHFISDGPLAKISVRGSGNARQARLLHPSTSSSCKARYDACLTVYAVGRSLRPSRLGTAGRRHIAGHCEATVGLQGLSAPSSEYCVVTGRVRSWQDGRRAAGRIKWDTPAGGGTYARLRAVQRRSQEAISIHHIE